MEFKCRGYEIKTNAGEPIEVNLRLISPEIPKNEEQATQFYNELISLLYSTKSLKIVRAVEYGTPVEDKSK
jgi:hypothetical protein